MNGHRSVGAIGGCEQSQLAALFFFRKRLLLVARFVAAALRHDPDLQQTNRIGLRRIGLTVTNTSPRAHALSVARTDDRSVAHAVLVREAAFEDVSNDLHVTMWMHGKTPAGSDPVLVDHAQRAKARPAWIVILVE